MCGWSWPPTRPTTTGDDPIAAASSARPGPITLSPTSPGSGSSAGPFSAASSANTSGPRRSPGQDHGRVLDPNTLISVVAVPAEHQRPALLVFGAGSGRVLNGVPALVCQRDERLRDERLRAGGSKGDLNVAREHLERGRRVCVDQYLPADWRDSTQGRRLGQGSGIRRAPCQERE